MSYASLIGFGGAIPFIAAFVLINFTRLKIAGIVIMIFLIYFLSVATGVLSDIIIHVGNFPSALIAGVFSPAIYISVFTVILRYSNWMKFIRKKTERVSDDSILDQPVDLKELN